MKWTAWIALSLLLAGCARHQTQQQVTDIPVTPEQRAAALLAVDSLRKQFNDGACDAIYQNTSQHFQAGENKWDWKVECGQLVKELGVWTRFNEQQSVRCAAPDVVICAEGLSAFSKGSRDTSVAWEIAGGKARLEWIQLRKSESEWLMIPPRRQRPTWDPSPLHKDGLAVAFRKCVPEIGSARAIFEIYCSIARS